MNILDILQYVSRTELAAYCSCLIWRLRECIQCIWLCKNVATIPLEEHTWHLTLPMQNPVDHSAMVDWVWRYFATAPKNGAASSSTGQPPTLASKLTGPVQLSSRPLYFAPCLSDHKLMSFPVSLLFLSCLVSLSNMSERSACPVTCSAVSNAMSIVANLVTRLLPSHQRNVRSHTITISQLLTHPVAPSSMPEMRCLHADKPPLYLQHEGHSRTIIGIEKHFHSSSGHPTISFLILDPSTRTGPLDRALREKKGWQVSVCFPRPPTLVQEQAV